MTFLSLAAGCVEIFRHACKRSDKWESDAAWVDVVLHAISTALEVLLQY